MENETTLLTTMIAMLFIVKIYVYVVSIGLSIYACVTFAASVVMFSAMIFSNIAGMYPVDVLCACMTGLLLFACATSLILRCISQQANMKLDILFQFASARLQAKLVKHWKILLIMGIFRACGLFDNNSNIDECIWTLYAAFIDD